MRRFFREQVRPYLGLQLEIGVCMVALVILELVDPLILRSIIDRALGDGDRGLLVMLVGLLLALMVFRIGFRVISVWLYSYSGLRILFDFRQKLFEHIENLSPYTLGSDRAGDLLSRLTSDIDLLQRAAAHTFVKAVQDILTIVGILGVLFWLDARLTLLLLLVYPVLVLLLLGVNSRVRTEGMRARVAMGNLYAFLEERLGAIRLIQEYRRQKAEARAHVGVSRPVISSNLALSVWASAQISLADVMTTSAFVLVFLVGGNKVLGGSLSLGSLVAFYTLATRLYRPLSLLIDVNVDLQVARASLMRVYEVLDRIPEIQDSAGAVPLAEPAGSIELQGVDLTWPDGTVALRDIDLTVSTGQHLALVGPSGGGKSTLAALIARYLDPGSGCVKLGGQDLRDVTLATLRRTVGLVPQETQLYHDTLGANLRLAKPRATDEELIAALRAASLDEFLSGLPESLETVVGEDGMRLSGGERQRLALARALLKSPEIHILDEATSALDSRTERDVLTRFFEAAKGRTVLTIAHRLETVVAADCIIVIAGGRIVERGTHTELMGLDGLYRELHHARQ
ncbi:MAG: ABC transporter ATP-binding protein [Candidatus Krumholzibacteria bacterium]|nr:ABC transporter ATP-binding protein [Candidatus Krumholzibacteria bacterium]